MCDTTSPTFPRTCGDPLAPGESFGLSATGMTPGETVVFTVGQQTGSEPADSDGIARTPVTQFAVPTDIAATTVNVAAQGQASGLSLTYAIQVPAATVTAGYQGAPGGQVGLDAYGFPVGATATVTSDAGVSVAPQVVGPSGHVSFLTTAGTRSATTTFTVSAGPRSATTTTAVVPATVEVSPAAAGPGVFMGFSFLHFQADETVDVRFGNPAQGVPLPSEIEADTAGNSRVGVTLTDQTCPGSSTVTAVGAQSGRTATAAFTVLPGDSLSAAGQGGCALDAGSGLTSANGRFHLNVQTDGNLVLYDGSRPVWATLTTGRGAVRLVAQADGNLVLYAGSRPLWWTGTRGGSPTLRLGDDGSASFGYGGPGQWTLWGTEPVQPPGDIGTQLTSQHDFPVEGYLRSPNGAYRLVHQFDGNMVLYDARGTAVWSTPTYARYAYIVNQSDGNVVAYTGGFQPLFNTGVTGIGNVLVVQDDGNLVVYDRFGRAVWSIR